MRVDCSSVKFCLHGFSLIKGGPELDLDVLLYSGAGCYWHLEIRTTVKNHRWGGRRFSNLSASVSPDPRVVALADMRNRYLLRTSLFLGSNQDWRVNELSRSNPAGLGKGVALVGVGAENAGRRDKQAAADCSIDRRAQITCHSRLYYVAQRSCSECGANEIGILIDRQENYSILGPVLSQFNGSLDAT